MKRPGASLLLLLVLVALAARADEPEPEEPAAEEEAGFPEVLHMPLHDQRAEQGVLQPVPIHVELPQDIAIRARRVLVHYRVWGDPDWTTLELLRSGTSWDGAIPCLEISTITGDFKYYIRVHDAEGRVVATGASRADPYRVTIRHDTTLAAGAKKKKKCPDPADCPRGLPGCPSERVIRIACHSDRDCEGDSRCSWQGYCEVSDRRTSWFSATIEQDVGVVATSGACTLAAQENEGYACIREDGEQYQGTPVLTNEPLGIGRGPTRIGLGFDQVVYYNVSIGLRVSWAVAGEGPTPRAGVSFVPFSASARVVYWFGDDPFAVAGFRPYVLVTGGYGMFDVATRIHLREDPTGPAFQGGNDLEQDVDLYKRAGDGFAGLGGGLAFAYTTWGAVHLELTGLGVFPFGAFVLAPSAGAAFGF